MGIVWAFEYTPCRSGLPSGVRGMVQPLAAAGFAATRDSALPCDCARSGTDTNTPAVARANSVERVFSLIYCLLFPAPAASEDVRTSLLRQTPHTYILEAARSSPNGGTAACSSSMDA